jgi:hypothetical protein
MDPEVADLLRRANEKYESYRSRLQMSVQDAIESGEHLLDIKARTQHGNWKAWLEANFAGSYQVATHFMYLARNRDTIEVMPEVPETVAEALVKLGRVHKRPSRPQSAAVSNVPPSKQAGSEQPEPEGSVKTEAPPADSKQNGNGAAPESESDEGFASGVSDAPTGDTLLKSTLINMGNRAGQDVAMLNSAGELALSHPEWKAQIIEGIDKFQATVCGHASNVLESLRSDGDHE